MKKFVTALVAAAVALPMATPALAKPHPDNHGRHMSERAHYRNWARGQHFDRRYAQNYQVINYRSYHRLSAPPRGYHWVRSGNDAVLVAITGGLIASVIANAF